MNAHIFQTSQITSPNQGRIVLLLMVLTSVGLCISITDQSLWIDEAVMAYFASYDELTSMFTMLTNQRTSDPQMPLYILYLWGWVKLSGASEYALRAANVPFVILLVTALGWTSWRVFGRPILWVIFCFAPFIWFYMNEARPYIAIIACSAMSTGALMVYFAERERYDKIAPWLCLSALWFACGLQMLSAFLVPSLIVLAMFARQAKRLAWSTILHDWSPALLVNMPLFLGLAAYFLWTLSVGAGGMRETPGFGNLAFSLYEFMGFMGLGPPRHVLRAQHNIRIFMAYWPWLWMGGLAALAFLSIVVFRIIHRRSDYLPSLVVALVTGVTLFMMASTAANFRFWGRHLAVFFPLFCFMGISALGGMPSARVWKIVGRTTVLALACVWLVSDARLWVLPQYHKDDYRLAARVALDVAQQSHGHIVWAANIIGGRYYGIEFEESLDGVRWPSLGRAVSAANWSQAQILEYLNAATRKAPVVLVLSKPDLYDAAGSWTAAVHELKARKVASPNTFNIYVFNEGGYVTNGVR